jgi:hypothetical protein
MRRLSPAIGPVRSDFVDSLRDLQMMRGLTAVPKLRALNEICDDHQRIYEQIVKRDPTAAAVAMREHLAVSSRLLIAQETGDLADVDKFELSWIDLLTLQRSQLGEESSDAEASDLSSAQSGESDKNNGVGSSRTRSTLTKSKVIS